jgi:hypothetical protein
VVLGGPDQPNDWIGTAVAGRRDRRARSAGPCRTTPALWSAGRTATIPIIFVNVPEPGFVQSLCRCGWTHLDVGMGARSA